MQREKEFDDWVYKCLKCRHCYHLKKDEMTLLCRCKKGCKFESDKKKRQ